MSFTIPTIFTAVDKISATVKRMTKNVGVFAERAEAGVARFDRGLRRLTPSLGGMAKQMLAFAGTTALIAGVGSAVNTIKEFEQANADLAAVMSSATEPQLKALQKDAARLGGSTAKTASEVVALQEAFGRLGFETSDIINMTEGTIAGSIAMNAELADSAELGGAMVKTFQSLRSEDMPQIMDQMTLATQKSALNFEKLQTALPIVAKAADASGVSFEQMSASLGVLADGGIDASSSATALRNIYLESAKRGVPYQTLLEKISKSTDKLKVANEIFGKRGAVVAVTLAENIDKQQALTETIESARKGLENSGAAQDAADKRLKTLGGTLTLLGSAWDRLLIKTNENSNAIGVLTRVVKFLIDNLETIVAVIATAVGVLIAMKTALFLARTGILAYNIALGVMGALSGTASIAIGSNTAALTAYNIVTKAAAFATKLWKGAQWLLNIALNANPIGLVVMAIAALVAITYAVIKNYESWGAALSLILGPFGMIINMIMMFKKNWQAIKDSFTDGGIVAGLKAIGLVMIDALLYPMQQLLELASKIPGLGDLAGAGARKIAEIRAGLEIEPVEKINPEAEKQNALTERIETTTQTNATLTVKAPVGTTTVEKDKNFMPVITSTMGAK